MEFISESIRVLSFLVCRFFNCEFNFLSRFRAIQVIYLFLRKLTIASLQLFLHSIEVTKFIRKKLMRFPYHHVICMESIVTSSLSPTIGNFVFPLFFSDQFCWKFINIMDLLKTPDFGFIYLLNFYVFYFIYFHSDLSFFLLTLESICCFYFVETEAFLLF